MTDIRGKYWEFYLEGRAEKRLPKHDRDLAQDVAKEMIEKGTSLRVGLESVAAKAIAPLESGSRRRGWVADHEEQIRAAGGDVDLAYRSYLGGRAAELAYAYEEEVIEALGETLNPSPKGEEDDDDDDDGEDEEEDEDEDD